MQVIYQAQIHVGKGPTQGQNNPGFIEIKKQIQYLNLKEMQEASQVHH